MLGILCAYLWGWDLEDHYFTQDNAHHLVLSWNIFNTFKGDSHPPLYYFLLKGVMTLFGLDRPLILRAVSLGAGFLGVVGAFFLGKNIGKSRTVGFLTAFILATSPLFITQSQVVRQYSLLVLFVVCLLGLFQKPHFTFYDFLKGGLILFLASCTHYSSLILFPAFLVSGLGKPDISVPPRNRLFVQLFWSFLVLSICFFSLYFLMYKPFGFVPNMKLSLAGGHLKQLMSQVDGNSFNIVPTLWALIRKSFGNQAAWGILILICIGIYLIVKNKKKELLILFSGPLVTGSLLSLMDKYPLNSNRHSIYLLPVFLIPMIWALKWINEKSRWALGVVFIVLIGLQILEHPNRYNIEFSRNFYLAELGPRFSELLLIKASLKDLPDSDNIMLAGDFLTSKAVEEELKPQWAIFSDLKNPIMSCPFWPGYVDITPCSCLKNHAGKVFHLILARGLRRGLSQLQQKSPCFRINDISPISSNYLLVKLQAE